MFVKGATLLIDNKIKVADDCYPRPKMTVTLRPEGGVKAQLTRV